MLFSQKLKGCLAGGAIGDAIGSRYEGRYLNRNIDYDFSWHVTDDTQLTLATCEAIVDSDKIEPAEVAAKFLEWFNAKRLTGLGASTLKSLRDLQVGAHWALAGRMGEYAAGNGAAMRMAPLAFKKNVSRDLIYDVCSITHKNDEAYCGALAVYYSVSAAIDGKWRGETDLIEKILDNLPDTLVKDRLIELNNSKHLSIGEAGKNFRSTGYVVDSVPLAIFAAQKIYRSNLEEIFSELLELGGDTDTICSIAGQITGTLVGYERISAKLTAKYNNLPESRLIDQLVNSWRE